MIWLQLWHKFQYSNAKYKNNLWGSACQGIVSFVQGIVSFVRVHQAACPWEWFSEIWLQRHACVRHLFCPVDFVRGDAFHGWEPGDEATWVIKVTPLVTHSNKVIHYSYKSPRQLWLHTTMRKWHSYVCTWQRWVSTLESKMIIVCYVIPPVEYVYYLKQLSDMMELNILTNCWYLHIQ